LKTKDHFSSSWASWVEGGKGHEFVVALPGVLARLEGVADHGVFIDPRQAGCLADAAAVLQVLEDSEGLVVGKLGAEQGGAFAFGEAGLASAAGEHPPAFAGAVAEADAEITFAMQTIVRAIRILTAKEIQVFHEQHHSKSAEQWTTTHWDCKKLP
jgi:hypothetical protein